MAHGALVARRQLDCRHGYRQCHGRHLNVRSLTVVGMRPADDASVACTEIYRFWSQTIPTAPLTITAVSNLSYVEVQSSKVT